MRLWAFTAGHARPSGQVEVPEGLRTTRRRHTEKLQVAEQFASGLDGFWDPGRRLEYYELPDLDAFLHTAQQRNLNKQAGVYVDRSGETITSPLQVPGHGIGDDIRRAARVIQMHLIEDHTRQQDCTDHKLIDSAEDLHWAVIPYSDPELFADFIGGVAIPEPGSEAPGWRASACIRRWGKHAEKNVLLSRAVGHTNSLTAGWKPFAGKWPNLAACRHPRASIAWVAGHHPSGRGEFHSSDKVPAGKGSRRHHRGMALENEQRPNVSGRPAAYRIYDVSPRFSDRGDDSRVFRSDPSDEDLLLECILGSVPSSYIRSINSRVLVDISSGHRVKHTDLAELDPALLVEPDEVPSWVEQGATYLTLMAMAVRPFDCLDGRRIFWVQDCDALGEALIAFARSSNTLLDRAASWLLSRGLRLTQVPLEGPTVFFEPADASFAAIYPARRSGYGRGHVARSGWRDADTSELEALVEDVHAGRDVQPAHVSASRWYFLAKQEEDAMKRFLFAWFGLEVLANAFARSRSKSEAHAAATRLLALQPNKFAYLARHLERGRRPDTVAFKFGLMAMAMNPDGFESDLGGFLALKVLRDEIAHGSVFSHAHLPRHDSHLLLVKYLRLLGPT